MTSQVASVDLILEELRQALAGLDTSARRRLLNVLTDTEQVFVVGVGRVLLAVQAFAKRLNHLGIPAHFVGENSEPAMRRGDLLIVASGSGRSVVPLAVARRAAALGGRIVHLSAVDDSPMSELAELTIRLRAGSKEDAKALSRQPLTSLFEQALWLYLDAICLDLWSTMSPGEQARVSARHANLE